MRGLLHALDSGNQAVSYVLGGGVLALAVAVAATSMGPEEIAAWAGEIFGSTFVGLVGLLVFIAVYAWVRMLREPGNPTWLEAGVQAANGITTLALTYTLFGISLGIGTLAENDLTPQTVQQVVTELTEKFSLAFMTTVVGLPLSAVMRSLLTVTAAHQRGRAPSIAEET